MPPNNLLSLLNLRLPRFTHPYRIRFRFHLDSQFSLSFSQIELHEVLTKDTVSEVKKLENWLSSICFYRFDLQRLSRFADN